MRRAQSPLSDPVLHLSLVVALLIWGVGSTGVGLVLTFLVLPGHGSYGYIVVGAAVGFSGAMANTVLLCTGSFLQEPIVVQTARLWLYGSLVYTLLVGLLVAVLALLGPAGSIDADLLIRNLMILVACGVVPMPLPALLSSSVLKYMHRRL